MSREWLLASAITPPGPGTDPTRRPTSCPPVQRATLYKYFPDARAVLTAWHERQITTHLDQLAAVAGPAAPAVVRL
jgi:hypothetical protein